MRRRGSPQTASGPSWLGIGLLLVLLMLGHDVLMASEALALPHQGMAGHQAMSMPTPLEDVAPQRSAPGSEHPQNCQVGFSASLPTAENLAGPAQVAPLGAVVIAPGSLPTWPSGGFIWPAPRWPPGRLRALLQVYRI